MTYQYRRADVAQEEDRFSVARFLVVFVGLVAITVSLIGVAGALVSRRERSLRPSGNFPEQMPQSSAALRPLQSRVYEGPAAGTLEIESKRRTLESFGWVDRDHHVVKIPISRAMELEAEKGR